MEKFKEPYLFLKINLNNFVLITNVVVFSYFLKLQTQFYLYFFSFLFISNCPANFGNKFSNTADLWQIQTQHIFYRKINTIEVFWFLISVSQASSQLFFLVGNSLVFNGCVIIASFIWPPFVCFSLHNSYFGNFYRVF